MVFVKDTEESRKMIIAVASDKGGTGKSIITASFASLAKNKVIADCDVDATDLHLLLHPAIKVTHQFK